MASDFTLISAFNQFWWAWDNLGKRSLTILGLYFYLLKQWNDCGRPLTFRHRNTKICSELSISRPTLIAQRNTLKQMGLIDFYSKGKGDSNISYRILVLKQDVEKLNGFTSAFTSELTSDFIHKQSTSDYIVIGQEVKSFDFLKSIIRVDEGLKRRWQECILPLDKFDSGVDYFFNLKKFHTYKNFIDFRNNFFFWVPNYLKELHNVDMLKQQQEKKLLSKSDENPNYRLKKINQ